MKKESKKQYVIKKLRGMFLYTLVFLSFFTILKMVFDQYDKVLYMYMIGACLYVGSHAIGFQPSNFHMVHNKATVDEFWKRPKKKRVLPSFLDIIFSLYVLILPFIYMYLIGLT